MGNNGSTTTTIRRSRRENTRENTSRHKRKRSSKLNLDSSEEDDEQSCDDELVDVPSYISLPFNSTSLESSYSEIVQTKTVEENFGYYGRFLLEVHNSLTYLTTKVENATETMFRSFIAEEQSNCERSRTTFNQRVILILYQISKNSL